MHCSVSVVLVLASFCASDCFAQDCIPFTDKAEFEIFNEAHGKLLKGVETFEESNLPMNEVVRLDDPLEGNVPNVDPATGLGFPEGLEQKNIIVQSNDTGGCSPAMPSPRGAVGLTADTEPFVNSDKVSPTFASDTLDLIFPLQEENHTGVGFELTVARPQAVPVTITVYNKQGAIMGTFEVPAPPPAPEKSFFGVWCPVTIGRINVCNPAFEFGVEFVDDIQMWAESPVPVEPTTWGRIKARYEEGT